MNPINKSQLIEVAVQGVTGGNTVTNITFPDQPFLRSKYITGISVYTIDDMSLSPLGNPLVSDTVLKTMYLTLYGEDPEQANSFGNWIQLLPSAKFHETISSSDPHVYFPFELVPRQIQWEKSTIVLASALGNTSAVSFVFNVNYQNTN